MTTKKQNLAFGFGFLALGVAAAIALDPWFLSLAFILIGGSRIFSALQMADEPEV